MIHAGHSQQRDCFSRMLEVIMWYGSSTNLSRRTPPTRSREADRTSVESVRTPCLPRDLAQSKDGEAIDDTQCRAACDSSSGDVVVKIFGAFKIKIWVLTSSFISSAKQPRWLS